MSKKTPNYDRMREGMTAKRFLRSILIDGILFGWMAVNTIHLLFDGSVFSALISLAVTVLVGYFGYTNYRHAVSLLDTMGFQAVWSKIVDLIEAENNKTKEDSDGDTAV